MIRTTILATVVAICAAAFLSAQAGQGNPVAVLVFADDIREVEVLDFTGRVLEDTEFGTEVLIGFAVRTGQTYAELHLEPNGSILRLAEDTFLKFEELQGLPNTSANSVALIAGGVRMVAARTRGQNYRITTRAVALGVRGTDFAVRLDDNGEAMIAVKEGRVTVYDPQTEGTASVGVGQALETGTHRSASADDQEEGLELIAQPFSRLRIADVPSEAGYESDFDYFSEIEWVEYREFFANDDYFADDPRYIDRFRAYYASEMEDFQAILEREAQELEKRERSVDEALREQEESFQDWLQNNGS